MCVIARVEPNLQVSLQAAHPRDTCGVAYWRDLGFSERNSFFADSPHNLVRNIKRLPR